MKLTQERADILTNFLSANIDKAEKLLEDNDNAVETDMKKVTV